MGSRRRTLIGLLTWVAPLVLLLSTTLPGITEGDWQASDGAWYAAIAVQAWRTGVFWTLQGFDSQPYFNKPPLVFWFVGAFLHFGGLGALTARLPSVVAATICVLATVGIARQNLSRTAAGVAGCVLALTIEFTRRTHEISLDLWQLAFLLLAVWLVMRGVQRERAAVVALSGVPVGLALLCKPLVALVAPAIVIVWLVGTGRRRLALGAAAAVLIAVVIAGSWHASMAATHGRAFTAQYLGNEVVDRAMGDVDAAKPPTFYFTQMLRHYWPWLPLAALGTAAAARQGVRTYPLLSFSVLWIAVWLIVLAAFPDRRDRYAVVLYPFFSILIAWWVCAGPWRVPARRVALAAVAIAPVTGAAVAWSPIVVHRPVSEDWTAFLAWVGEKDPRSVWQGAFSGHRSARVYLAHGWWPRATRAADGSFVVDPASLPAGSWLLYHRRDGLSPGPNERVVVSLGDLSATQLESAGWRPVKPGER